MDFSLTGIAFLLVTFSGGFLFYRVFLYWSRVKDIFSKFFFLALVPLLIYTLIRSIDGLFFLGNIQFLVLSQEIAPFLHGLGGAFLLYLCIYRKISSRIWSWIGFLFIFSLGLVGTYLMTKISIHPEIGPFGTIDWGISYPFSLKFIRMLIFLLGFGPFGFILFQDYRTAEEYFVKMRAFGLCLVILMIIFAASLDFIFVMVLGIGTNVARDIILIVLGLTLFFIVLKTQKSPPKYVKKIE